MGKKSSASRLANKNYRDAKSKYRENIKRKQAVKAIPQNLSNFELEVEKARLEPVVREANRRIQLIKDSGLVSRALDRVEHEGGSELFNIDYVSNREELLKENTRLRVFIADKGSTIEGAELETAQINAKDYKGKFGNEFNNEEHNHARFDTRFIDKDVAARAFESYRKIEEHRSSQLANDGGYGSENMIIALYDAEIRGYDSQVYGEDLLDLMVRTESDEWKKAKDKSDSIASITGIVEDNITGGFNF